MKGNLLIGPLVICFMISVRAKKSPVCNPLYESCPITPRIYYWHVNSVINNHFARTSVVSKAINEVRTNNVATFSVSLPEAAFISEFIVQVNGRNYTSYIKQKEEADSELQEAMAVDLEGTEITISSRDCNMFIVKINVQPQSRVAFYLTYDQILKRKNGQYEQVINVHPGQLIRDFKIQVSIQEKRKITHLSVPIRLCNQFRCQKVTVTQGELSRSVIKNSAIVSLSLTTDRQKLLTRSFGRNENKGFVGQFAVQYKIESNSQGGDVCVKDGYFVHFFSPTQLTPLPKHVVFVLDTSYSMNNQKITQLKDAMRQILEQLHSFDVFSLVEFNSNVKIWDLANNRGVWYPFENRESMTIRSEDDYGFENYNLPVSSTASESNINKAKRIVSQFQAIGHTDIYSALKVGLYLTTLATQQKRDIVNRQPLVVFLTDGSPTVRLRSKREILEKINKFNSEFSHSPIYSISFGSDADTEFVRKLALNNSGHWKHIYDDSDASLQLQNFYKEISTPLLSNVDFDYASLGANLTQKRFPIFFNGSEFVVSGNWGTPNNLSISINGWSARGKVSFTPTVTGLCKLDIKRLWGYLMITELLEDKKIDGINEEEIVRATNLALEHSFVTPLTSLVLEMPQGNAVINTKKVRRDQRAGISYPKGVINAVRDLLPPSTTPPPIVNNLSNIPWLNSAVQSGILNTSEGSFKLGLNETFSEEDGCPEALFNTPASCKLLHFCPQIHPFLSNIERLLEYACIIKNEYIGICCPKDQRSPK